MTTWPAIPLELFRPVVRCSHPVDGGKIRCLSKQLSYIVTAVDLMWGEAGWKYHHQSPENCFFWAAECGHVDVVRALLDNGMDVHRLEGGDAGGAVGGDADGASSDDEDVDGSFDDDDDDDEDVDESFDDDDEDVDSDEDDEHPLSIGVIALCFAAKRGHLKMVRFLLESGVDTRASGDALCWAAMRGHLETVQLLLKSGADVHFGRDLALRSAMYLQRIRHDRGYPVAKDRQETVHLLLTSGADVHVGNDEVLQWAAQDGHLETVQLLLKSGADVHARDDEALRCAATNGHLEIVRLLLDSGANAKAPGFAPCYSKWALGSGPSFGGQGRTCIAPLATRGGQERAPGNGIEFEGERSFESFVASRTNVSGINEKLYKRSIAKCDFKIYKLIHPAPI
ncbi:hypothetical protein HK104_008598 [Borealophlyctis nickersoniae]|nr:hypothetical protein HK104_008598 [Borealophlyctis nickersoniae]